MLSAYEHDDILHQLLESRALIVQPRDQLRDNFDESFLRDIHIVGFEFVDEPCSVVAHRDEVEYFEAIF